MIGNGLDKSIITSVIYSIAYYSYQLHLVQIFSHTKKFISHNALLV